jgi:hypothetical protein
MKTKATFATVASTAAITLVVGLVLYGTFVSGTTKGADFIAGIQNGQIQATDVRSLRVLIPPVGYTPFSKNEMDALAIKGTVSNPAQIRDLITALRQARSGRIAQNHPVTEYDGYWQVDLSDGSFFYLYVTVHRDRTSEVCYIAANRKNATNPNGAVRYRFDEFREMLHMVGVETQK